MQWQKPWEKQGKNPGQESGQESGQKSRQKKSGSGQQGSRGQQGWQWTVPPHRGQAPLLAAAQATAALGTAAFVKLSENEEASGDTGEMRMLQASRKEIAKKVDDDDRGFSRLRHKVVYFLDLYVWEPLCTGFRFIHLALIFVPVILAVPAIWIGRRQRDRNNERAGTLWWYGFLVKGMEWAGPAFIKVRTTWMLNFEARKVRFQSEFQSQVSGLVVSHPMGQVLSEVRTCWRTHKGWSSESSGGVSLSAAEMMEILSRMKWHHRSSW